AAPVADNILKGLKVLIATASPVTGPFVTRQIMDAGAEALLVTSGAVARRALAEASASGAPYTSLICDATLPDMSGEALLRDAHNAAGDNCKTTVLLPVGARKDDIKDKGFDAFLIKPVRQGSLTRRLALIHGRISDAPEEERASARRARKHARRLAA